MLKRLLSEVDGEDDDENAGKGDNENGENETFQSVNLPRAPLGLNITVLHPKKG